MTIKFKPATDEVFDKKGEFIGLKIDKSQIEVIKECIRKGYPIEASILDIGLALRSLAEEDERWKVLLDKYEKALSGEQI